MIDKNKLQAQAAAGPQKTFQSFGWDGMAAADLIHYRDEILAALKKKIPISLMDLNLEEELLLQFATVRALQSDVADDDETPANQRAQVANSVSSCLKQITDLQNATYTAERLKRIEAGMIRWLSSLDPELARPMLEDYAAVVRSTERK